MTPMAAQFTGKNTKKKLDAIAENLERLEWFGVAIAQTTHSITYWHYADSSRVA